MSCSGSKHNAKRNSIAVSMPLSSATVEALLIPTSYKGGNSSIERTHPRLFKSRSWGLNAVVERYGKPATCMLFTEVSLGEEEGRQCGSLF